MRSNELKAKPSRLRVYALAAVASVAVLAVAATHLTQTRAAEDAAAEAGPPAAPVTVAAPERRRLVEYDEFTGRFMAIDSVELRARVSGYLETVDFEDGAEVEAGALLFRIDARPFEAELAAAEADLARAAAARENARAEHERGLRLLERSALSQEEADRRARALKETAAAEAAARARADQARLNLEFTEVRAPVSGRISDNFVSEGNLIVGGAQGGTLLSTIVSLDPIYFEFTASEADLLKYARRSSEDGAASGLKGLERPVYVRLADETDFVHEGRLTFVDNQIDRATGAIRARATFDNPSGVFAPGMFARLRLAASSEYTALLIPDSAVQTDQNRKFVWVANADNVAERREIELGPLQEGLRIVRSGLGADDRVIVSGTQFVMAGAPLAPEPAGDGRLARLNLDRE